MKTIVILGGGFAGIYTAKHLLKEIDKHQLPARVILMSEHNFFLFTPMLHEVATGGISRDNLIQPITFVLKHNKFTFYKGRATHIDTKRKKVVTESFEQEYDALILATGSRINFFNIKGAQEYSIPLRTLHDAYTIKNRIISQLQKAQETREEKNRKKLLTFAIVGGGPTGVELAGELAEFINIIIKTSAQKIKKEEISITIHHRGKEILDMLPPYFSRKCREHLKKLGVTTCLECGVSEVMKDSIKNAKGTQHSVGTTFWTAGFRSNTTPLNGHAPDSYLVDDTLTLKEHKNILAVGDCAHLVLNHERIPMLAQVAVKQSQIAAHNALCILGFKKNTIKYRFKLDGFLISVGQYFGVAGIKKAYFSGFFAWWLWRTIYLSKLLGWANKFRVAVDWTLNFFYPRDTSEVEHNQERERR